MLRCKKRSLCARQRSNKVFDGSDFAASVECHQSGNVLVPREQNQNAFRQLIRKGSATTPVPRRPFGSTLMH